MNFPWHLYLMAALYILAGLNHFRKPRMYERIIPPHFPNPRLINIFIGAAEILLGILLCIPMFSPYAASGIMALLIVVFPANLYMCLNKTVRLGIPLWILLLRLPLQIVLIFWAIEYATFLK